MSPESRPKPLCPDAEPFRCDVSRERGTARVRPVGALDLATAPVLEAQVAELRAAGVRNVVLDLSALAFIDSTGLRCVLRLDAEARRDGFSIAFVPGPRAVQRVFDVTRTAARLTFVDD